MEKSGQSQPTHKVILEYPYRPFGWLQITATQLVFKKIWPGINTFSGVISISDLREVRYIKGTLSIDPSLEIIYRLPNNQLKKIDIYFPGFPTRFGIELRSGITPEKVFETIESLRKTVSHE